MNRAEVRDLLTLIEGFERRPFPEAATDAWFAILHAVEFDDAAKAVTEYFDQPEAPDGWVQPGPIRRRANAIAANRTGKVRQALESAAARAVPPNEAYLAARAAMARRLGDPERLTPRRTVPADTVAPTSVTSGVTNDARNRALNALRAYAA